MKITDYDNVNYLVSGMMYSGEVLIVDFGIDEGVDGDKFYVVLNDGEIVEIVNKN